MIRSYKEYSVAYQHLRMERSDDGVLEVALHSDGGPYVHGPVGHREFPDAFWEIGADPDNRVLVLTGTGADFCARGDWAAFTPMSDPDGAYRTIYEGTRLLTALLDIDVPVIGAVNGAAHVHSELVVMSDIVIADERASFRDNHFDLSVVPGDGNHTIWLNALGENRGRHFLLTSRTLTAREAAEYGVVAEVVPDGQLLLRAHEIARQLVRQPPLTLRYSRLALTQRLKRLVAESLPYGLAVETLSAVARSTSGRGPSGSGAGSGSLPPWSSWNGG